MKKTALLSVLFVITCLQFSIAQGVVNSFWVWVNDEDAKPQTNENFTNIREINIVFNQYGVTKYEQVVPFANADGKKIIKL